MANILMVDDDEDFVRVVQPQIAARGYEVRVARSGANATAMCEEQAPDGVLLDGLLPDTTGIVWLAKFRMRFAQTPVWFISAFRFAQEAKSHARITKDLGARVLSKPVQMPELLKELSASVVHDDFPDIDEAELLGDLEAEFSAQLPAKLERLREAVRQFTAQPSQESYQLALMQAHKLHGTAGMYGLRELGARAGDLEKSLREAQPTNGQVNQALIAKTQAMLAGL